MIMSTSCRKRDQPVQLPNHDDFTEAKLIQEPVELGPVPTFTGSRFAEGMLPAFA